MALTHRKKHGSAEDGNPAAEKERLDEVEKKSVFSRFSSCSYRTDELSEWSGEEYEVLLRYVADQQSKIKNKKGDEGDGDGEDHKYTRNWYTFWKKTKVEQGIKNVCYLCSS